MRAQSSSINFMQAAGLRSRNGSTSRRSRTIQFAIGERGGIGGTRLAVEQRDLAEHFAGAEIGEDELLAPHRGQRNPHHAEHYRHHAVAVLVDPADRIAGGKVAEVSMLGELAARLVVESGEQRTFFQ